MSRTAVDDNMIVLRTLRLARKAMLVQGGPLVVVIGLAVLVTGLVGVSVHTDHP